LSRSRQDPDVSWRALWRLADHAIGKLGAVKLKDLTAP
jgi:hypothetical protein